MKALNALLSRRSIRRYRPEPVPAKHVRTLLDVAMRAPSAADARPWHFVVIDRKKQLVELADAMPHCDMLREAPLALLVVGDPSLEKIPGFWMQDTAAATENILLAAHAMGYGAVWIGLHPVEERVAAVRRLLGMPASVIPLALVSVGLPAETLPPEDRYDEGKVHRNAW